MKAKNDRVIIAKAYAPEKTKSGLFIPADPKLAGQAKMNVGRVLSAGPGMKLPDGTFVSVDVQPGDIVCWEQFGDIRFELLDNSTGNQVVVVRATDIGCVLEPGEYDGYVFETKEFEAREKAIQDDLAKAREKREKESEEAEKRKFVYACQNKKCSKTGLPMQKIEPIDLICEYCGEVMEEVKTGGGVVIHVSGGTPQFHAR